MNFELNQEAAEQEISAEESQNNVSMSGQDIQQANDSSDINAAFNSQITK